MKDSEFIELLNLYLDHEITAGDAARLESEVQNSPARRQVYHQYCRMQKACKVLAADFQSELAVSAAESEKKVVSFEPAAKQRKPMGGFYALGTAAVAAACVALIFTVRNRPTRTDSFAAPRDQVAVQATSLPGTTGAPSSVVTEPIRVAPAPGGLVQRPMLVSDPLLLAGKSHVDGEYASVTAQANDQLEWIRTLQLAPLQQRVLVEDLRFDMVPATLRPDSRTLGGTNAPAEASAEMTAFRFVR